MIELVKTSIKLLFRNVGFWLCLLALPILSTYILTLQQDSLSYLDNEDNGQVIELGDIDEKVAYRGTDGTFVVKVYDASGSELSDYMLNRLASAGLYKITRVHVDGMSKADIDEKVESDGQNDRMGAALYISEDFDKYVIDGEYGNALTAYVLSEDERFDAFKDKITSIMEKINLSPGIAEYTGASVLDQLENMDEVIPEKNVVTISGKHSRGLSYEQERQKTNMGYAYSFMTLSFVLCGVIVASGTIHEQHNDVVKRIALSGTSTIKYFASKLIVGAIISVMLSGVLSVCSLFINNGQLGMSRISLIFIIFCMGLIFCTLSIMMGILTGNLMGATITAFIIWCMSSMLSGLYFPLTGATKLIQSLSFIMPQKWFVDGAEMIFVGDNKAFIMLLCITAGYLAVILSLGSLGLKIRRADSWGNS